jgi:two-component system, response regulator RegA
MKPPKPGNAVASGRPSLLIVDDDETFCSVMSRNFATRGFHVQAAHSGAVALQLARDHVFDNAVVDLQLPDANGLQVLRGLREAQDDIKLVILTGYSSIVTAVSAVKLGAVHYLCKPVGADDIVAALNHSANDLDALTTIEAPSVQRVEWEHIQRVLAQHSGCIAATARALHMHRRTLQRKLQKRPPRQ